MIKEMKRGSAPEGALPYMMRNVLERLRNYEHLSSAEAREVMLGIATGLINDSQVTAFIAVFMMRRPTTAELQGFVDALMELSVPLELDGTAEAIDIVGTGGDGKNTFNISTLSALIVAGAGYRVIKHGNYSASSMSGSADVLSRLGYCFHTDAANLNRQLEAARFCFLHAPLFHPAMKRVAHIRRNLTVRTFFNLLGPLSNPAQPRNILLGANSLAVARLYHYYMQSGKQNYRIIYSIDGYDEISLTGDCKVYGNNMETVLQPSDFACPQLQPSDLSGGNSQEEAADILLSVLENRSAPAQEQVALANSSLAVQLLNQGLSLEQCMEQAKRSLHSGEALNTFKNAIHISRL